MTAAHCTMDFKSGMKINVYTEAQDNPVSVGGGVTNTVDRYVQHPSFNRNTMDNDITLLHLSTPLTFKSNVCSKLTHCNRRDENSISIQRFRQHVSPGTWSAAISVASVCSHPDG